MSKSRTFKRRFAVLLTLCVFLSVFLHQGSLITYADEGSVSADLSDFLTAVSVDAPVDGNGNYLIRPNTSYELSFFFAENESLQFADTETLSYSFPAGMIVNNIGQTDFSISISDENGDATVAGNTYEIAGGQLLVRFNQADPNFARLTAASNVRFRINVSSAFDQTVGQIVFHPSIVKDFVFDDTADLTIDKSVNYIMEADTAFYELRVCSEGVNENVVIEDHLTGTALVLNQDVVVVSGINGTLSVTPDYTAVENGFCVTIPQMVNGEIITLRYSAAVDNTKISSDGTVEQTNNTARVTSDQVPGWKEASADFAGQARFHRVEKHSVGDAVPVGENLYEQAWEIRVNEDHRMPMGGTFLYDWITTNSRPFM